MADVKKFVDDMEKNKVEVENILTRGAPVVPFLMSRNEGCGEVASFTRDFIAEGVSGTVWNFNIPGDAKRYVVKRQKIEIGAIIIINERYAKRYKPPKHTLTFNIGKSEEVTGDELQQAFEFDSILLFYQLNGGKKYFVPGEKVYIPPIEKPCLTKNETEVTRLDYGETYSIPAGSYICSEEVFSEYLISLFVGKLFSQKKCINFIDTLAFYSCGSSRIGRENKVWDKYTLMQKIDGTLYDLLEGAKDWEIVPLYIQALFAIASYQKEYKIVHGDLHLKNVFYEKTQSRDTWGKDRIENYSHFSYNVDGVNIYFDRPEYIIKIGDWGLGCKYSVPVILNKEVLDSGKSMWVPNWYDETYDMLFFTAAFLSRRFDPTIQRCLVEILSSGSFKLEDVSISEKEKILRARYINPSNLRPIIYSHKPERTSVSDLKLTPKELLKNSPYLEFFRVLPPIALELGDKILEVGRI